MSGCCTYLGASSPAKSAAVSKERGDFSTKKQLSPNVCNENSVARPSIDGMRSTTCSFCVNYLKRHALKSLPIVIAASLLQITSIQAAQQDASNPGAGLLGNGQTAPVI